MKEEQDRAMVVLEKRARAGEQWENWVKAGNFAIMDELLTEIEWAAFASLKLPTFNIEDKPTLYKFQANLRTVETIREMINKRIEDGRAARAQILQDSTPQEAS